MSTGGFRKRVAAILTAEDPEDFATRLVNLGLLALIALNGVALVLETVRHVHARAPRAFAIFEEISIYVFTAEYALRLWSGTSLEKYRRPLAGRVRFALSPMALVDLVAILPFYLPVLGVDLRSVRLVRLFRLFRMAKVARYSRTLRLFGRVARRKKEELITVLAFVVILLVLASTLLYYAENEAQPESFSSIPATMWWAVATLTTVGYGDMSPVTDLGKLLGAVIAVLGIGVFALPAGILGSGFMQEVQGKPAPAQCPHCGKPIAYAPATRPSAKRTAAS